LDWTYERVGMAHAKTEKREVGNSQTSWGKGGKTNVLGRRNPKKRCLITTGEGYADNRGGRGYQVLIISQKATKEYGER